jgi:hypothetical protein
VPILISVSIVIFALIKMAPGDAAISSSAGDAEGSRRPDRAKLGLDKPCTCSTLVWLGRMVRRPRLSIVTNEPVAASLLNARQYAHARGARCRARFRSRHHLGARRVPHGTILDRVFSAARSPA